MPRKRWASTPIPLSLIHICTERPKLDDDFAADASEYNTFAEYKDSIVKELNDRAAKNNEIAVENALVEKAVENASMYIPQAMINEQTRCV